jgi:hypothetical protein
MRGGEWGRERENGLRVMNINDWDGEPHMQLEGRFRRRMNWGYYLTVFLVTT